MSSSQARTAGVGGEGGPAHPTDATRRLDPGDVPRGRGASVEAPLVLDRYRLHRRLGAGAFGTVWMARDERLERDVAVKLLARERVIGGRFEREARAAARLAHPGIVTLYEAAVDDEGAYLVSELVIGATLDALLAAGRLSDRDIVWIAIALCDALEHAHAHGVVHRDVKPSNVLVPDAGGPGMVPGRSIQPAKLTDFGVARVIDSDSLTSTGDVLGTLAYMAPEQAEGLEAGAPADLYSVALVVYEALTGINPVGAGSDSPFQRARRLGAHLPPLRRQRRDLPAELGRAIDLALRPRPRERGTVADLRRSLQHVHAQVGDEPGIVTSAWTSTRQQEPVDLGLDPLRARSQPVVDRAPADHRELSLGANGGWPARGLAAVTAGAFAAWICARVLGASATVSLPPAAVGLLAAGAVLALPRLGWGVLTVALCAAALVRQLPGAALVIAIAALAPVLVAPARPTAWPLSAAAPALGLIGLAGAWPALAGRAAGTLQRAALGAIGWVWVLLASAATGRVLYLPRVPGLPPPSAWTGSVPQTTDHLLATLISSGVLAPALVWALAAAVAPWLVRGRAVALDVVRVVGWSALVISATSVAVVAVHGTDAIGSAPTAVVGALGCAAVALAPLALARWRAALRSESNWGARLP